MHTLAVTTIYQLDSRLTQKEENCVWYWKPNQLARLVMSWVLEENLEQLLY